MTLRTLSLLEIVRDGRTLGHLIGEAPDVWVFRAADDADALLPAWSALRWARGAAVNQRAWFRQLLPDPASCIRLARRLGISPGNDLALLGLAGRACRGNLGVVRPGAEKSPRRPPRHLDPASLATLAANLVTEGLDLAPDEADFLLPGEAGQFPCSLDGERLTLAAAPRWIARVGRPGLEEAVENEALIRRLAKSLDLPCPESTLLRLPTPVLVQRAAEWDADEASAGHLETFGQLAGLHPEQAFEREGGLAVLDCANLIRRYSAAPALDLKALLGWLVLSFFAGMGHAHAGTLAFVDRGRGPRLTITDGWLCTQVYPALSERLAMYVGREDRPDWIRLARWRELARELGIGQRYLLELVRHMAMRVPALAQEAANELALDTRALQVLPRILRLIDNRARQALIALAAEAD